MSNRKGRAFISGQPVGLLEEAGDTVQFTYLPEWLARKDAVPVSVTLPLRALARDSPVSGIFLKEYIETQRHGDRGEDKVNWNLCVLRASVFPIVLSSAPDESAADALMRAQPLASIIKREWLIPYRQRV